MINFEFEWDPGKAKSNMQKHGVTFEEAATVMHDRRAMNMYDPDHSESASKKSAESQVYTLDKRVRR